MKKLPNTPREPLARDELLLIMQCDQPSLAAENAHFSNVIDVHHRVSMDTSKAGILELFG